MKKAKFIHLPIKLCDEEFEILEAERERQRRPDGVKCHKATFYGKILSKKAKGVSRKLRLEKLENDYS